MFNSVSYSKNKSVSVAILARVTLWILLGNIDFLYFSSDFRVLATGI